MRRGTENIVQCVSLDSPSFVIGISKKHSFHPSGIEGNICPYFWFPNHPHDISFKKNMFGHLLKLSYSEDTLFLSFFAICIGNRYFENIKATYI